MACRSHSSRASTRTDQDRFIRVGFYFDIRNPPAWRRDWARLYAQTLEHIEWIEQLGGDAVWLSEHHFFEDGYLPQTLTFAAAVAARTRRLRIGTAVLLAPLRPAVQIAEDAALVDVLSNGRVELGMGAGYRIPEFASFGADFDNRAAVLGRRAREIRHLYREGRITPPPVQQPIPMWLGYMGAVGARRTGRLGEGLLSLDRALLGPYLEGLAQGGHDLATARMGGAIWAVLADDPEAAWSRIAPHLAYQWDSYRRYQVEGTERPVPDPIDPEEWRRHTLSDEPIRLIVGTADEVRKVVEHITAGLPITDVFFWASIAGMPEDLVERHIELVCTQLLPALRRGGS